MISKSLIVVASVLLVTSVAYWGAQDWFLAETESAEPRETMDQLASPAPQSAAPTYTTRSIAADVKRRASGGTGMNLVQQTSGTICETPSGSCDVPDRPINAPCKCGDTWGQITR